MLWVLVTERGLEVLMVSVDGMLDGFEVAARARVAELCAEVERVTAALAEARRVVEDVETTRRTLGLVLAAGVGGLVACPGPESAGPGAGGEVQVVPLWREDLAEVHLPATFRAVYLQVVGGGGPVRARAVALALGWDTAASPLQGLRYRLGRLAACGWLVKLAGGQYAPVPGRVVMPVGG